MYHCMTRCNYRPIIPLTVSQRDVASGRLCDHKQVTIDPISAGIDANDRLLITLKPSGAKFTFTDRRFQPIFFSFWLFSSPFFF